MPPETSEQIAAGLHHAARRYCIDRIAHWHSSYTALPSQRQADGYHYTAEARNIFPRYNVLDAILADVERFTPESLSDESDPREALCEAALTADSFMIRSPNGDIEEAAMQDERNAFCAFVRDARDLDHVEPLPYRRVLSNDEADSIEKQLRDRWDPERYDYPLVRPWLSKPPADALAFQAEPFYEPEIQAFVREALRAIGTTRVFQVGPERQWKYELELSEFEPVYTGEESWWSDQTFAWRIFASHESLTSVAGMELVNALVERWPEHRAWLDDPKDVEA